MPISLPPLTRRRFLAGSAAGLATLASSRYVSAGTKVADPNHFALFSDTHISGDPKKVAHDANMTDNFVQASREVLQCDPLPSAVLVCGDCAYLSGKAEDYRQLSKLVRPVREGGVAMHFAMGNHDHRERFWAAFADDRSASPAVQNRHVTVVQSPHANWFLLDSLDETNKTPGVLGPDQLAWLGKALDQHKDKPALVMVHHNPDQRPEPSGLVETRQLLDLLTARPQVKALFYGHSHHWALGKEKDLHLVNLPPVAYLFNKNDPLAWVDVKLNKGGMVLTLQCLDTSHKLHAKQFELGWS